MGLRRPCGDGPRGGRRPAANAECRAGLEQLAQKGASGNGDLTSDTGVSSYRFADLTNYFGTLTIGGGSGNSLILNNSWAAGGDPSTYTPKGLVVKDGATLRFNAEPFSYTNRGLYVESTGGVLHQVNISTHVLMPLTGEGTLTKTGSAQTTFNGTWTGVTIDVREGTLAVQSDCPEPGEGSAVVISGASTPKRSSI